MLLDIKGSRHLRVTLLALLAAGSAVFSAAARADDPGLVADLTTLLLQPLNYRTGLGMGHEQPPPVSPASIQAVDPAPVERLFDDWGGLQPYLLSRGINLQFNALTEFAGNVTGGTHQ